MVLRNLTLKPLYTGTLTASSKYKRVEEKAAKHQFKTMQVMQVTKDSKAQLVVTHCVISFARNEEMLNFEEEYKKATQ